MDLYELATEKMDIRSTSNNSTTNTTSTNNISNNNNSINNSNNSNNKNNKAKHTTQSRASRPKVKTGCNNCKRRRVKCDEERPSCRRCVKSNQKCEGYPASKRPVGSLTRIAPYPGTTTPTSSAVTKSATRDVTARKPRVHHIYRGRAQRPNLYQPSGLVFEGIESKYFQVFQMHTASELSGFFDSEFWTRSVLQESHSEASIRHAVVALGALYKTLDKAIESPAVDYNASDTASHHYNFALQQYTKAITQLRESLARKESRSQRTILISIVLFTCFESFTGDHKSAIMQIQTGLRMLEAWRPDSAEPLPRVSRIEYGVEDELIQIFTRLAIQAKSYDMAFHFPTPYVIQLSPSTFSSREAASPTSPPPQSDTGNSSMDPCIPDVFCTVQEARQALDDLTERIMRLNELLSCFHPGPNNILPRSVASSGNRFKMLLSRWEKAFQPLLIARHRAGISSTERAGIDVLKMFHIMTSILFFMAFSTSEMDFDNFTLQFREIVDLAQEVVVYEELDFAQTHYQNVTTPRRGEVNGESGDDYHLHHPHIQQPHNPISGHPSAYHEPNGSLYHIRASFALDLGIVPPLFVVATKCRDRKLRRKAVALLTSSPRREGMWDSILCGRVAQWIMDIEEEDLVAWDGPSGPSAVLKPQNDKRVMVKQILFDLQRREATLRCGTRGVQDISLDARARETQTWW